MHQGQDRLGEEGSACSQDSPGTAAAEESVHPKQGPGCREGGKLHARGQNGWESKLHPPAAGVLVNRMQREQAKRRISCTHYGGSWTHRGSPQKPPPAPVVSCQGLSAHTEAQTKGLVLKESRGGGAKGPGLLIGSDPGKTFRRAKLRSGAVDGKYPLVPPPRAPGGKNPLDPPENALWGKYPQTHPEG